MTSPRMTRRSPSRFHSALDRRRRRAAQLRASLGEKTTATTTAATTTAVSTTISTTPISKTTKRLQFSKEGSSGELIVPVRNITPESHSSSTSATYVSSSSSSSGGSNSSSSDESPKTSLVISSSPTQTQQPSPPPAIITPRPLVSQRRCSQESCMTQATDNTSSTMLTPDQQQQQQQWFPQDPMTVTPDVATTWIQRQQEQQPSTIPEESSTQSSIANDTLDALIAETSLRWKSSTEQVVQNTTTRRMSQTTSLALTTLPPPRLTSSISSPMLLSMGQQDRMLMIQQQQAEIEALRARLTRGYSNESAPPQPPHVPTTMDEPQPEQIDDIPVEHIEICVDTVQDDLTVWSGWTKVQSSVATPAPPSTLLPPPPVKRRPDADEASSAAPIMRRAHEKPLHLTAANGAIRRALYTGPLQKQDECTGVGVLKFVDTGDVYQGMVVRGEMHGMGTYTQAKNQRVLKGVFEHNVFVQWE